MIITNTVDINHNTGHTTVYCNQTDEPLDSLMRAQLSKYESPIVLVSGGLDSQMTAHLAKAYTSNPLAVIYDLVWKDNTINGSDLVHAQKFCKHIDLPFKVITVDITEFLERDLPSYARKYKAISPQILSHMYAIEQSNFPNGTTLMMGGEPQFITTTDSNTVILSSLVDQGTSVKPGLYMCYYAPFEALATELGITIIRDPGMLSPEIHYQIIRHNLDVISQYGQIGKYSTNMIRNNFWPYKNKFYQQFGYDFLWPLSKKTGFETIQIHLAATTGIYNQFDNTYRNPLVAMSNAERWFGRKRPVIEYQGGGLEQVLSDAQLYLDDNKVTVSNIYKVSW